MPQWWTNTADLMFTVSDYITQASFKSLEKQWMPENGKKSASEKRRWNLKLGWDFLKTSGGHNIKTVQFNAIQ